MAEVDQQRLERDIDLRRFDYDDRVELVADFGPASDVSIDIVGDTAILVVDGREYDLEVDGDAQAFMRNGVLTIEVTEE